MVLTILLILSIAVNILLVVGVMNLLSQNEQLEDIIITEREEVMVRVNRALQTMREIDLRGSFESDDEVGSVFTELKGIIKDLSEGLYGQKKEEI